MTTNTVFSRAFLSRRLNHCELRQTRSCIMSQMSKARPFRVSIEGNIGSGKSTCLNFFNKWEQIEIHPEPIDKWRNVDGHNLLGLLYSDLQKWNFPFQHYVHLSRLQIQTSLPSSEKTKVKMFERSVQNNRFCFMENALRNKLLTECEFQVLVEWYDWVQKHIDISLDLIVYLKSSPDVVFHRMTKRGRIEESGITLEYLKQVHNSYEKWLSTPENVGCKIITIDANQEVEDVKKQLEDHTMTILGLDADVSTS